MSLAIDVDDISRVLLTDGWHDVIDGSFDLDSYEYLWSGQSGVKVRNLGHQDDPLILQGGGQSGVCATGFSFKTASGTRIAGPLTAIFAVEYAPS